MCMCKTLLFCLRFFVTTKLNVENLGGHLNNRTCALRYHLIKSESPNLQVHSGLWPRGIPNHWQQERLYYWELNCTNPVVENSTFKIITIRKLGQQCETFASAIAWTDVSLSLQRIHVANARFNSCLCTQKLDGVGPIDNRPSTK